MELTHFTDYSLRALIYLGRLENRTATIREISDYYGISKNHLRKIITYLAHKGYVKTSYGCRGGNRLAKTADSINIGQVVRETEETLVVVECIKPGENACPLLPDCRLKKALNDATGLFFGALDQLYLSDLLNVPKPKRFKKKPRKTSHNDPLHEILR